MKFGLVNIYAWRPHVEHLVFIQQLLENDGHETVYLTCDSRLPSCYTRQLKNGSRIVECSKCIVGGVRSYKVGGIESLFSYIKPLPLEENRLNQMSLSSACTLERIETEDDLTSDAIRARQKELNPAINIMYQASLTWLQANKIDAVICFNGRMDVTRAIIEVCKILKVPFITYERSWFGDGLLLNANSDCLSVKGIHSITKEYENKPLNMNQAIIAGRLIAQRFKKTNTLEWRVYNKNSKNKPWPNKSSSKKILILPSSKNEFISHPDWTCEWSDNTLALNDLIDHYEIKITDIIVRFHPNWSENIGKVDGDKIIKHYTEWCEKQGIFYIRSQDKHDTYSLLKECDLLIVNSSTSAVDAAAIGKKIILLGEARYSKCSFVTTLKTRNDFNYFDINSSLDKKQLIRSVLRYSYSEYGRYPQYVNYVKAIATTQYKYKIGADSGKIIEIVKNDNVRPDDNTFSDTTFYEDQIIDDILQEKWDKLITNNETMIDDKQFYALNRVFPLRWLNRIRELFKIGDR